MPSSPLGRGARCGPQYTGCPTGGGSCCGTPWIVRNIGAADPAVELADLSEGVSTLHNSNADQKTS